MAVTFSKQCCKSVPGGKHVDEAEWARQGIGRTIHFLRSDRWPPTSKSLYESSPIRNVVSVMPVDLTRERRTSWSEGR
jgi:hypothetical protein